MDQSGSVRGFSADPGCGHVSQVSGGVYAILVGVSQFRWLRGLTGARNDAEDLAELLVKLGVPSDRVTVLLDEAATRLAVENAIRGASRYPQAKLLVYIASHGALVHDRQGDDLGYILLHDSTIRGELPPGPNHYLTDTPDAIGMGDLIDRIHATQPNRKLIVIDACYSGSAQLEGRGMRVGDTDFGTQVMVACGSRQLAAEGRNGCFTSALMSAIRWRYQEGVLFSATQVLGDVQGILKNGPQYSEPQDSRIFLHAGDGEFWFDFFAPRPSLTPEAAIQRSALRTFDWAIEARRTGDFNRALQLAMAAETFHPSPDEVRRFLKEAERELLQSAIPGRTVVARLHWDGLHYVQLADGKWMSQTPVTVRAFYDVIMTVGYIIGSRQRPDEPIVGRRYSDAVTYCSAVGGRVPTSEEWMMAARARPDWPYPWGPEISPAYARYGQNTIGRVGSFPPSPTGFLDIVGNVWEWCSDPPRSRGRRAVRGGSFHSSANELKIDFSAERDPEGGDSDVGFRCVLHGTPQRR